MFKIFINAVLKSLKHLVNRVGDNLCAGNVKMSATLKLLKNKLNVNLTGGPSGNMNLITDSNQCKCGAETFLQHGGC